MARFLSVYLSLVCLFLYFQTCYSLPGGPQFDEYPHVVKLQINDFFLYKLTITGSNPLAPERIDSVLQAILTKYHVKTDQIILQAVRKTLTEKIKFILRKLRLTSRSGYKRQALLNKWKNTKYDLNLSHRTGSPTKRKSEEVEDELNRSYEELDNSRQVLAEVNAQNRELKVRAERLFNPKKRKVGERGRSKHKEGNSSS